jgi:thymidylate kinase
MHASIAPWLCILGPDGSGKSTLLNELEVILKTDVRFCGVARFHWRPGFLRGRKFSTMHSSTPHSARTYGTAVSLIKLVFLYCDWLLGYGLKLTPLRSRGIVVMFDRHLMDMLIDPQRYRFGAPLSFVQCAVRLLPQPNLIIVLDAPASIVQARKQEVKPEETDRQLRAYRALADGHPSAKIFDATRPPRELAREIVELLFGYMS